MERDGCTVLKEEGMMICGVTEGRAIVKQVEMMGKCRGRVSFGRGWFVVVI